MTRSSFAGTLPPHVHRQRRPALRGRWELDKGVQAHRLVLVVGGGAYAVVRWGGCDRGAWTSSRRFGESRYVWQLRHKGALERSGLGRHTDVHKDRGDGFSLGDDRDDPPPAVALGALK